MTENEIRPDALAAGQQVRMLQDVGRMLSRMDEFVEASCPACENATGTLRWEKFGLRYLDCAECGTTYISPRPSPAVLEWFYKGSVNYAYWNQYIFPASEDARRERIFRPRAERVAEICQRYKVTPGTLMEIGAGFGTFCEEVRRLGTFSRVLAVEPMPDLAETCRRRGLEVIEKPIEQVSLGDLRVDVIACFEVIEHLFSPREFVRSCAALLKPGGLLVVTCPNIKGFDLAVLREASLAVDVEHMNYFHPDSLSRLVRASGLEVLEVTTPGKLDAELVRKKVLAGEFDLSGQPFLQQVLIDCWESAGAAFQEFLAANCLSSHLWLVARKSG